MRADQSADLMPQADSIRLFLCGDVMTGRGIDQVLAHPNDPRLHEPYIGEARSLGDRRADHSRAVLVIAARAQHDPEDARNPG